MTESRSDDENAERAICKAIDWLRRGKIQRSTYFKWMAKQGYQQAEALKLAENWDEAE